MTTDITDPKHLTRIVVNGFKSIRTCDLELRRLNVLIGPNGAGKSNFIGAFRLLREMLNGKLQLYVGKQGGPDALLHFGRKTTETLSAELYFGNNGYKFVLAPTDDNRMIFESEVLLWNHLGRNREVGSGHFETQVEQERGRTQIYDYVVPVIRGWRLYHFHDTSDTALVKRIHRIPLNDAELQPDGRNLAAFLLRLYKRYSTHYQHIRQTIQLVAPFFDDFYLHPDPDNPDQIELAWKETGEEMPFKAHLLSDGTLRFMCLATVLMQPVELRPPVIIIDEPELGLHPYGIRVLASMLRSASKQTQIIVSTQSTDLLNEFGPNDVVIADRQGRGTELRRLDEKSLETWLQDYSLGELWHKNLLGGRPWK